MPTVPSAVVADPAPPDRAIHAPVPGGGCLETRAEPVRGSTSTVGAGHGESRVTRDWSLGARAPGGGPFPAGPGSPTRLAITHAPRHAVGAIRGAG